MRLCCHGEQDAEGYVNISWSIPSLANTWIHHEYIQSRTTSRNFDADIRFELCVSELGGISKNTYELLNIFTCE